MKNLFSTRNTPILFILVFWILDKLGLLSPNGSDYLIVFLVGVTFFVVHTLLNQIMANRVMNLVLYNTLLRKGVITRKDTFLTQNDLVGNTSESEGNKLRKKLKSENIYLHEYLSEEDLINHMKDIETRDHTIFQSFADLVDCYKESYIPKIVPKKQKNSDLK